MSTSNDARFCARCVPTRPIGKSTVFVPCNKSSLPIRPCPSALSLNGRHGRCPTLSAPPSRCFGRKWGEGGVGEYLHPEGLGGAMSRGRT